MRLGRVNVQLNNRRVPRRGGGRGAMQDEEDPSVNNMCAILRKNRTTTRKKKNCIEITCAVQMEILFKIEGTADSRVLEGLGHVRMWKIVETVFKFLEKKVLILLHHLDLHRVTLRKPLATVRQV